MTEKGRHRGDREGAGRIKGLKLKKYKI